MIVHSPLHVARRHDRDEGGRPAGVLRQFFKELVLEAAVVEEDIGVDAEALPQGHLQVGLEAADPADLLRVGLVVEMRVADEYVVLESGNECHGATAASPYAKPPRDQSSPTGRTNKAKGGFADPIGGRRPM